MLDYYSDSSDSLDVALLEKAAKLRLKISQTQSFIQESAFSPPSAERNHAEKIESLKSQEFKIPFQVQERLFDLESKLQEVEKYTQELVKSVKFVTEKNL
eukprot:Sdes_comp9723_c0_seq1m1226